jgi:protocatechuate 3,4-dioxygenase beta subunit
MKKDISIYIPEPCHEDWRQMSPTDKGRFCQSCAKQVVDFSVMSDQQILNYMATASGGVCGRFGNDQLQRPLQTIKKPMKKTWWVAVVMPVMMVFERASAQEKPNKHVAGQNIIKLRQNFVTLGEVAVISSDQKDNRAENDQYNSNEAPHVNPKITVWRKKGQSNFTIKGIIKDENNNKPIPYAAIYVKGTKTATAADASGTFTLTGDAAENNFTLVIDAVGYSSNEKDVALKDNEPTPPPSSYIINGRVVDMRGTPIPFASVTSKGWKNGVATDANGEFKVKFSSKNPTNILIGSAIGFETKEVLVSAADTSEITITLNESTMGLSQVAVTAGKVLHCDKPKQSDTIKTAVLKVFNAEPFKIFPNPAQRGQTIIVDTKTEGEFVIQVFDNSGKLLQVKEFNATGGVTQMQLSIPSSFLPGMYYIRLIDNKTQKQNTDKIVVL